jgi:hypothetical protein
MKLMKFLPGLAGGFGVFLNPWVLVILGVIVVSAFFYGLNIGNSRLESYQIAVKAVGQAQEDRTLRRIKDDKRIKKEADDAYKTKFGSVVTRNRALLAKLRKDTGGSVLPPVPAGAASPDRAAFDRAELDRALREFTSGAAELIGEGDKAVIGLDTAKGWAAEQKKAK